jgi:hypothetical protein
MEQFERTLPQQHRAVSTIPSEETKATSTTTSRTETKPSKEEKVEPATPPEEELKKELAR